MRIELIREIEEAVRDMLDKRGVVLVDFKLTTRGDSPSIKVVADFPRGGITLDECGRLNKDIAGWLEKEKTAGESFSVEVVSPGLHYKLKSKTDFLRVQGSGLGVWLKFPVEGKKYLEGVLAGVEGEDILLEKADGDPVRVPLEVVQCAKQKVEI